MGSRRPLKLARVGAAVTQLDHRFAVGGALQLSQPVVLRFDGKTNVRVGDPAQPDLEAVARKLVKQCAPAVFGLGAETIQDERVRHGGQCLARDGGLEVTGLDDVLACMLASVHADLCGGRGAAPRAELYGLNVYGRGGHFASHKDTPRDPEVFGTLVACLPISFHGGRLVLEHETQARFDWAFSSGSYRANDELKRIQWAAFFGDVDHRIEPVITGTRVTLTWNLYHPSVGAAPETSPPPSARESALDEALTALLGDPAFLPEGGLLGVPCNHLYTVAKAAEAQLEVDAEVLARRLKGRDLTVARALQRAGMSLRVVPHLYEEDCQMVWRLDRSLTPKETLRFTKRRLKRESVDKLPFSHYSDWNAADDVTWVAPPPWERDHEGAATGKPEPQRELLGQLEYSETGYFGNEGSDAAFYVAAALIAEVPPYAARASKAR